MLVVYLLGCVTHLPLHGFLRQEYWSGLPCPPIGDLPDPGIKPLSPGSPALAGVFFTTELPEKPQIMICAHHNGASLVA